MFLSFENDINLNYISTMLNIDCIKDIKIDIIKDDRSTNFVGKEILITSLSDDKYSIYGFETADLYEIYRKVKEKINEGFTGVYEILQPPEDDLYTINIYPTEYTFTPEIKLTGPLYSAVRYMKDRFEVIEDDTFEDFKTYAVYYIHPFRGRDKISKNYNSEKEANDIMNSLFNAIDNRESEFRFE